MKNPVPVIVLAQLFGTSLWFSANSAADDLIHTWGITPAAIGTLTNAVQLGFILGTLSFAVSGLADRFAASRIFAVCALLGALCNAAFALFATDLASGIPLRFAVGLCLAGVYPLGMKLVVSWVPERAGAALAQLVGMLTLGTALPHGIRLAGAGWSWQATILVSSALALIAAALIFRLGDGPHLKRRHDAPPLRLGRVFYAFSRREFRASALGYFGHQWELYAFWTLVPSLLVVSGLAAAQTAALSGLSFAIIAIGALGCVLGGWWSQRTGSARVAATALGLSALCCALFPVQRGVACRGKNRPAVALGGQRGSRFAAFFGAFGARLPTGDRRQRTGHPELDWLRHHDDFDSPRHGLDRRLGQPHRLASPARAAAWTDRPLSAVAASEIADPRRAGSSPLTQP